MASRKIQTYQNKANNLILFILCLTWTVNANSLKQNIIVKYVLLSCHLGWMNRRFCLEKGGSQEHIEISSDSEMRTRWTKETIMWGANAPPKGKYTFLDWGNTRTCPDLPVVNILNLIRKGQQQRGLWLQVL